MSKPVCHVNLASVYGGGERQTELLLRELAKRGWPQRLVVRRGHALAGRCRDVADVEIRECAANPVAAGLAARGSMLVHAHEARGIYSGLLADRLFGVPFLLTRRVVNPQKPRWMRDKAYRRAAAVVAISKAAAAAVQQHYTTFSPEIVLDAHADLPVDDAEVDRIRDRHTGRVLIGHVGALIHEAKGQMTIVEAARIAAEHRPEWLFLLLGSGRDEAKLREAAAGLRNVEFAGFVDNVGDYLAAMDLFVFPSLREAVGSTLLDAMHFGLPIVATNVGGIPEVVEDGVNGILVEPEEPEQLYRAIALLIDDRERAAAMRATNRVRAAKYDSARMADAYEAIYRRILG